ncbi:MULTISPECIES: NB-ARC domain-containing protein [unclassified Corynebacterium]|uniref:NB-ARC domain-containing protein n=1 Tax=unclassified Corynebacterium TaxID=2624378 RepID=UPI002656E2EE|nr:MULTISPECIES: NB-ARC domain-containing protein [unclassified Corynebacterium]MDN8595097.1 NB-ARC domain-containing protein [Corynebacterium sp. P4_F2]WKK54725.1 NB-ARC domain-containing protein [Corynebacterium sp. P4-C1]WKK64103.1 NB-ARC domain-containing protein [Corynebacterium sp. P8-C1]
MEENANLRTADVFVPGMDPKYTYNPREDVGLEDALKEKVDDGGAIVVLTGPTKSGKTVLARRCFEDPIWIDGVQIDGIEKLWLRLAVATGVRVVDEVEKSRQVTNEVKGSLNAAIAAGEGGRSEGSVQSFHESLPISLENEVTNRIKENRFTLVIDDFHFVSKELQEQVVQALKPLVYLGLRVVVIAITHRWNDVSEAVDDMGARIEHVIIPRWTQGELEQIASAGCSILNVTMPTDIRQKLAAESFGSPHIMQKACRTLVRNVNKVEKTSPLEEELKAPSDWDEFFKSQVSMDAGKWVKRLLDGPKTKGTPRKLRMLNNGETTDTYGLVLAGIACSLPKLDLSMNELRNNIASITADGIPRADDISRVAGFINAIASTRIGEEQEVEFDEQSDEFLLSSSEPVVEVVGRDTPQAHIYVADPFFAYFLRWGDNVWNNGVRSETAELE